LEQPANLAQKQRVGLLFANCLSRLPALSFYIAFGKGSSRFAKLGVAKKTVPEIWNAVFAA
jgi:hypothetical protein